MVREDEKGYRGEERERVMRVTGILYGSADVYQTNKI